MSSILSTLQSIVQEVSDTDDFSMATDLIVSRTKYALSVDVCSIYLNIPDTSDYILSSSDGLRLSSINNVVIKNGQGLVGLVAEKKESFNLNDVVNHPRYEYFPETGEERFQSFLGVPIVHRARVLGVLVVQRVKSDRFGEDDLAFLVTLAAQLAGVINTAEISGELKRPTTKRKDFRVKGLAGAPGVAIGTAVSIYPAVDLESVPERYVEDMGEQKRQFLKAVQNVREDMRAVKDKLESVLPEEEAMLFDAYLMMLSSNTLLDGTLNYIQQGLWAATALRYAIRDQMKVFNQMEDEYLKERAGDLRDLGQKILAHLFGNTQKMLQLSKESILVGDDISASYLADLPANFLAGMVCRKGSSSSHIAIFARALGIPTVVGAADLPIDQLDGQQVVVDGYQGEIVINPSESLRHEFMRLRKEELEMEADLLAEAAGAAILQDGEQIPIFINSGLLAELDPVQQALADGVGLYRTEIPFMARDRFPGEDEQTKIYQKVLRNFTGQPVVLRTLDVGGDKALSYFPVNEENPFLGWRGIRITLDHPEIFMTQLRAMLRASEEVNNLRLLLPMIGSMEQFNAAEEFIKQAYNELCEEGLNIQYPKIGVMIEIPSAIYLMGRLAKKVDFFSIGTNDLIQYLLAVDRNNAHVAGLYQDMHPSVLMAIQHVIKQAHEHTKKVSVCGEMASNPMGALLLIGLGIDSLSVTTSSVPRIKRVLRCISREYAEGIAEAALQSSNAEDIQNLVLEAMIDSGLGGLVRAGRS